MTPPNERGSFSFRVDDDGEARVRRVTRSRRSVFPCDAKPSERQQILVGAGLPRSPNSGKVNPRATARRRDLFSPGRDVCGRGSWRAMELGLLSNASLRTRQVTIESGRAAKAARRLRLSAAVRAIVSFRVLRTRQVTIESGRAAKAARRLRLSVAVRAIVSFRVLSPSVYWTTLLPPLFSGLARHAGVRTISPPPLAWERRGEWLKVRSELKACDTLFWVQLSSRPVGAIHLA